MPQKTLKTKVAAAALILAFTTACTSSKPAVPGPAPAAVAIPARSPEVDYVAVVRGSTMSGYPAATIGKAFETKFREGQWHSSVTSEGVRIVNFTAPLPATLRQSCLGAKDCPQDSKVTFRWTFAADSSLFHLSYVDPEPWPPAYRSTRDMLLFIYG
ncbi:MAG: hypothetical protein M3O20_11010 [Acidobacteriota bacterium]|nr:hypothetical protein [Acidobacteriota bacterium]